MLKTLLLIFGPLILMTGLVVTFGPREPVDETVTFDAAVVGTDVDAYLANIEQTIPGITLGAQKQIVWNNPAAKSKTPIALVYLHGFSATLEETRPMPDLIAKELGANIYYARLRGHGRDGEALAAGTINDWFNDTAESVAIGRAIGDRVIVLGVSTGATFATWAATKPDLMKDVAGMAFVSPNYGINNPASFLLTLGAARTWVPWLVGSNRSFETVNDGHKKWWTSSYPTVALLPMAQSVKFVRELPFETIKTPVLMVFHPDDDVVLPETTKEIAARWGANTGSKASVFEVSESEDKHNHVITGRILSPKNSAPLAAKISEWIKSL